MAPNQLFYITILATLCIKGLMLFVVELSDKQRQTNRALLTFTLKLSKV